MHKKRKFRSNNEACLKTCKRILVGSAVTGAAAGLVLLSTFIPQPDDIPRVQFVSKAYVNLDYENSQIPTPLSIHTEAVIGDTVPTDELVAASKAAAKKERAKKERERRKHHNDGYARSREEIYGKISLAKPYNKNWDYYDCAIPYNMTTFEVGGLFNGGSATDSYGTGANHSIVSWDGSQYLPDWPASPNHCGKIGFRGSDLSGISDYFYSRGGTCNDEGAYGFWVNGEFWYFSAIQYFFYPKEYVFSYSDGRDRGGHSTNQSPYSDEYYNWHGVQGELFDAILTDGSVIHCVASDANGEGHTNHGLGTKYCSPDYWSVSPLWYPQYACLFSCYQQTSLEIAGVGDYSTNFENNHNLGTNKVAYVRMYDKTLDDIQ